MRQLGLRPEDFEETISRSSGPGGQSVNKLSTAVTLVHRPSGLSVTAQDTCNGWIASVLTCSALENIGIRESWQMMLDHRAQQQAGGHLERRCQAQALSWMRELIESGLQEIFQNAAAVQERLAGLEHSVRERSISPSRAARELLRVYQI
jgi:LAO/AO transport system kinase